MQFLQTCKVHGSLYVYLSYGSLRKDWLSCPFRGDVRISAICGCGISKFPTGKTWESTNATSQKPESRGFPQLGGGCDRCGDTAVFPRLLSGGEASPSLSRITIDLNFERKLVGLKRKQSPFFTVATLEMFEKTPQLGGLTNPFAKYAPVKLDHFFFQGSGWPPLNHHLFQHFWVENSHLWIAAQLHPFASPPKKRSKDPSIKAVVKKRIHAS